jgi:DNA-binding NtrC family response regulator
MLKTTTSATVLVVDDAPDTVEVLQRNLSSRGYRVYTASSVDEALRLLDDISVDLVITDWKMPRVTGLDLVKHVNENLRDTGVMMITGYPSIGGAVEAMKAGAENYLAKPFTEEELFEAVERAVEKLRMRRATTAGREEKVSRSYGLVWKSDSMRTVFETACKAANSDANVLITGESGTGKELVARAIHYESSRSAAPFVAINCGGIPGGLVESELFGHVKGAFTGAIESRAGFFQAADGGTIFLDEIGEMSLNVQVKLLRVLEDKQVFMVGSDRPRQVNVRIIAATNKDLASLVGKGLFREDLSYRLSVITIPVPPLRKRGDDVFLLIDHFVRKCAAEMDREPLEFSDAALEALAGHNWPGNVRELENTIRRLAIMVDTPVVNIPDLPALMRYSTSRPSGILRTLNEVEQEHIKTVLDHFAGNKTKAAKALGIDRKTLREKLKDRDAD